MSRKQDWMEPRDKRTFRTLIAVRISGCEKQKKQSNVDQEQHCREFIPTLTQSKDTETKTISCIAKGEVLEREEIAEIERELRTGKYDAFIVEDLGRLLRDVVAKFLFGIAADHKTRAIAIMDGVDTWEDSWEEDCLQACADHVAHNRYVSRRVKFKTMNRFKTRGELFHLPIAGYERLLQDGRCDQRRLDELTDRIKEGATRLLEQRPSLEGGMEYVNTHQDVANWFNSTGFGTGPFSRSEHWTGVAVRRFYSNPMLKGRPSRGTRVSEKKYESGKRRPVKNPRGPNYIDRPELAHLTDQQFDALQRRFAEQADLYCRAQGGDDVLSGLLRNQSRMPGRCLRCWYCGRQHVWGANGRKLFLMCSGSRQHKCWCSMGSDGRRITRDLVSALDQKLRQLPAFKAEFEVMLDEARRLHGSGTQQECVELRRRLKKNELEQRNIANAISKRPDSDVLLRKLAELEEDHRRLESDLASRNEACRALKLPGNLEDMLSEIRRILELDIDSYDLGKQLRPLVVEMHSYVVKLIDSDRPLVRTRIHLDLLSMCPKMGGIEGKARDAFQCFLDIDHFNPVQRVLHLETVARLTLDGLTQRAIVEKLKITRPAVQAALKLHRLMQARNLTSPYVVVTSPSQLSAKHRRHQHADYTFCRLRNYDPPLL